MPEIYSSLALVYIGKPWKWLDRIGCTQSIRLWARRREDRDNPLEKSALPSYSWTIFLAVPISLFDEADDPATRILRSLWSYACGRTKESIAPEAPDSVAWSSFSSNMARPELSRCMCITGISSIMDWREDPHSQKFVVLSCFSLATLSFVWAER